MAPAHGAEDYAVFQAEGLLSSPTTSIVSPVDGSGKYSSLIQELTKSPDHGERLVGKSVLQEGTEEILHILKETGVLIKEEPYKHRYPYDTRTGKPMIIRYVLSSALVSDNLYCAALQSHITMVYER